MRSKACWVTLLVVAGLGGGVHAGEASRPGAVPQVTHALPPLRLPTIERSRTIDLRSYRGKKLLLIEFASW